MIWRSIISKLWATIIALVTIVLLFLTVLLLQFFENSNIRQTQQQLVRIAEKSAAILEEGEGGAAARSSIYDIADVYSAGSAVVTENEFSLSPVANDLPRLNRRFFEEDSVLKRALSGHLVQKQGSFTVNGGKLQKRMVVVGVPVHIRGSRTGAVYVFQSLQVTQTALDQSKKLIYISTGMAIILTTFFAFFLSTRIGSPLRKMRTAAIQVSRGDFDMHVPVITRDEVGELAVAFNKMRRKLKKNITALNQEKEQLGGIVNNMADGVLLFDGRGRIAASNPPAGRFLQALHFEQDSSEDRSTETPEELVSLFQEVTGKKNQKIREISVQGRFWVVIMTPLYDRLTVRGAVAVLRDMTEEQHIEQMKKGFVANVSHELRTPVSMIQGYSEAIIDEIAQTDQEKKDMARIILDESKRLGRLVNELLDLAKLEAGYFQLDKKEIPLADFLNHAVGKFKKLADSQDIKLVLDIDIDETVRYMLDPDRMEQVLTNLIDNAMRHTPEGGTVSVLAAFQAEKLSIQVRDTGSGIAEEDLPFVFERFYKADKSRTRGKSGTGLGLAIAKHIVVAHGGQISVNSRKGEGTSFQIGLPASGNS